MNKVYVYDPTQSDRASKVRGIGRTMQIIRENFKDEFNFVGGLKEIPYDSTFINPFFNFLQTPLLTKKIAKKQVAIIHDLIPLKYPKHFPSGLRGKLNIFLNKLALKNYDHIIAVSEQTKKDIINILGINESKIKVVYQTILKTFLKSNNQEPSTKQIPNSNNETGLKINNCDFIENWKLKIGNYCLYVGDATWNKNLVNLAKAIKIANVNCVFVGKVFDVVYEKKAQMPISSDLGGAQSDVTSDEHTHGDEKYGVKLLKINHPWQKELKEFFQEIRGDKRFILKGYVSDEELIELYRNATLNLLVSRDEGFGFSYLEAASQGCPTLLADIPVFHEVAGDAALFTDPKNPEEIAKNIKKIYDNDSFRSSLGLKAKNMFSNFNNNLFKVNFKKIIES